jgi:hypothetical protein
MPKPEVLIPHLRGLRVDPQATRHYEMMSGGFFWSDERPGPDYSEIAGDYAMRFLFGYRASLVRGQPRADLRSLWEAVLAACPEWPGFLTERCSPALAEELARASKSGLRDLDRLDRVLSRAAVRPNNALQRTAGGRPSFLARLFSRRR